MRVIRREPSVNDYKIPRDNFSGKFHTTFNPKGKMFNEMVTDILYTPTP